LEQTAKHPAATAEMQRLVADFLKRELTVFAPPPNWKMYQCVGPDLFSYLANARSAAEIQRLADETRRARDLFAALVTGTISWLEQPFRIIAFDEVEYLANLGAVLARYRPDIMRRIYNVVFGMTAELDTRDSLKVFRYMARKGSGGSQVAWHIVQSDLFKRHWTEEALDHFGHDAAALLLQCGDRSLVLAEHFFAGEHATSVINAVRSYFILQRRAIPSSNYISWNLAYRCVSLSSYADTERAKGRPIEAGDATEEMEMILFYTEVDSLTFIGRLERLCLASEFGEFEKES
jgi:hypothetical protein